MSEENSRQKAPKIKTPKSCNSHKIVTFVHQITQQLLYDGKLQQMQDVYIEIKETNIPSL